MAEINFSGRDKRRNCHDRKTRKSPETLVCHDVTVKRPRSRGGETTVACRALSTTHLAVKPMHSPKMRSPKPQQVVPVGQAPTNSGTKTAPFFAFSRCSFVGYQRLRPKREPPAVPDGARVCDRSSRRIHHQQPTNPSSNMAPSTINSPATCRAATPSEGGSPDSVTISHSWHPPPPGRTQPS